MKTATSLRLVLACIGVVSILSAANASLPLYPGPGGPVVANGTRNPNSGLSQPVGNTGVSVAMADAYLGGIFQGQHAYRWDTTGAAMVRLGGGGALNSIDTHAYAVSKQGYVVGQVGTAVAGNFTPVIYPLNSTMPIPMQSLEQQQQANGYTNASAYLINDSTTSAGMSSKYFQNTNLGTRAVRWAIGGSITELQPLNTNALGYTDSYALSMNQTGSITGVADRYSPTGTDQGKRGVRWAANSTVAFELDTPFVRNDGFATVDTRGINQNGAIIGTVEKWAGSVSQGDRAVRWDAFGTAATVLDTLGADFNGVTNVSVGGINDAGMSIGICQKFSNGSSLGFRAVRWAPGGTAITELGLLPGVNPALSQSSSAYRINQSGTSVGISPTTTGFSHATLWPGSMGGTTAVDLNSFLPAGSGWTLVWALGISDTGFISGEGSYDPDGVGGQSPYQQSYTMLVPQAGTYGQGDANFDTKVNFDDLLILAQNYGSSNFTSNIHVGDLNLDGTIGFDDLLVLAQHYGLNSLTQTPGNFASDWALAQSMVPEPTVLGLVIFTATMRVRRRTR